MENVERARKKRRTTRGLVTKLLTKIEDSLEQDRIEIDCRKLKQFQADLKEKAECLKEIDGTILDGLIDVDADDDTCENEAAEANEIQEKIRFNLICLEEALESIGMKRSTSQESVAESLKSNSSISESHRSFTTAVRVKLPKLELRKFNGKLQEWNEFWDSFNSAVHTDPGLAKVDKFKYLRSFLEEPVRRVISGLALTDDNYDSAVEILSNRYAKPMQIKRAHINDIMNLPPVFNERNIVRLRHLYDDIETHFRGLEALGADKDSYSSVVVPVVMEKIPEAIRINMIRFGGDYLNWNLDELLKALAKELEIREIHTPMLRMNYQPQTAQNQQRPSSGRQSEKTATTSALFAGKERDQKNICQFCLGNHLPEDCSKFTTVAERKNILFKFARCFLCLNKGHRSFDCRSKQTCRYCNGKHNHLICKVKPNSLASDNKVKMQSSDASAAALNPNATTWVGSTESSTSAPDERVALQTALARVKGRRESRMRVLFDTGSQKTFISAKAVDRLALKPLREESLGIKTFGKSEPEVKMREVYELELEPLHNGKSVTVEAFLVDEISTISNVHVEEIKKNYQHLCDIYFSDVSRSEDLLEIDILIGANYLWSFHEGQVIRGGQQDPVAIKTVLGYVLSGPVKGKNPYHCSGEFVALTLDPNPISRKDMQSLNKDLHKLWDLETLGIRVDEDVHQKVIDDVSFNGQRYSVGLPWKAEHGPIPLNYNSALIRLKNQLRKLHQTPDILMQYDAVIKEQLESGIISEVTKDDVATKVSYLPHQPVIREEAETTKVRVVYDASCKDRSTKTSLNDCLHVGPALNPLMFDILIRFREHPVVLVGDIEKAFLNIEVHRRDRDCLRFLWVKDVNVDNPEIVTYRFNRVVFGVNSSPFLLNAVIRNHLDKYKEEDPQFVDCLTKSFFVDDLVTSCKDPNEAFSLYEKAKLRMSNGGFKLRKWKTNDETLSKKVLESENEGQSSKSSVGIHQEKADSISIQETKKKVLGLAWDSKEDLLEFDFSKIGEDNDKIVPTKRGILSTLATLFDPLGLLSPVAVVAKILFQDLCLMNLGWDDSLPQDKLSRWEEWIQSLRKFKIVTAPRCLQSGVEGEIIKTSLHGFGDASGKAYCAAIYIVVETSKGVFSRLICSKTRVAPLKGLSIPRLELMAAKILTTLMDSVINALSSQTKIDEIRYWTDSMTVLYWIQNKGEWKTFVQHRVDEILKLTKKDQWSHVVGLENPADIGSRGVSISNLNQSRLWWEGPLWLSESKGSVPSNVLVEEPIEAKEERKKEVVVMTVVEEPIGIEEVIEINRYSKLGKLLRVTAYVQRFISNLKNRLAKKEVNVGRLEVDDIEKAEMEWIKSAQKTLQSNSDYQKYKNQLGIVDEGGILVCKGRMEFSQLEISTKNPIILPKCCRFTELIILDCHEKVHHCQVNATLAELRTRFWVTKGNYRRFNSW